MPGTVAVEPPWRSLMRPSLLRLLSALLLAVLTGSGAVAEDPPAVPGTTTVALVGATLIDGRGGDPLPDSLVVVTGSTIDFVGRAGDLELPAGARVLELRGSYLLPGLIDTHFHVDVPPAAHQQILSTALAFGITTFRDPAPGRPDGGVALRRALAEGRLLGPRMLTTGTLIDGSGSLFPEAPRPTTEEEMRREVRAQVGRGVDAVKLYMNVPPTLLRAAIDEAHGMGVKAIGHLKRTSWTDAARNGIDALVHFASEGPTWELLGRRARRRFVAADWPESVRLWARYAPRMRLDGVEMERLVAALREGRVEVNPTLVLLQALYFGNDTAVLARLEPQYASAADHELWGAGWETGNPFMRRFGFRDRDYRIFQRAFPYALAMTRHLHDRGVLLTAGSDVSMPWITPGVGLHRELELLVEAGIRESEVLRIATLNGAEALGLAHCTGSIEPGKSADLLVLDENPLEDIRATRSLRYVLLRGAIVAGVDGSSHPVSSGMPCSRASDQEAPERNA